MSFGDDRASIEMNCKILLMLIVVIPPLTIYSAVSHGQTFSTDTGVNASASTTSSASSDIMGTGTGGLSRNDIGVSAVGGTGGTAIASGGTGVGYGGTAGVVDSGNSVAGVADSGNSIAGVAESGNSVAGVGDSGNSLQGQSMTFSPTYNTNSKAADLGDVVPNMYAPPISAGSNPCAIGVSASAAWSGFGFSGGAVYVDDECTSREWVRLLGEKLGKTQGSAMIMKAAMCQSSKMWDALEVAAMELDDSSYACKNQRPGVVGRYVSLRPKDDLPRSYEVEAKRQHPDPTSYKRLPARAEASKGGFGDTGASVGGGGFNH